MKRVACLAGLALFACGAEETAESFDGMTTTAAGITSFVKEGKYKTWRGQAAPQTTASPHGQQTKVFVNPTLEASMQASATNHPKGSIAVKEFYSSGALAGHTVAVKTTDGTGGDAWVWFEGTAPSYASPTHGKGLATCISCHQDGKGFIFSPLP